MPQQMPWDNDPIVQPAQGGRIITVPQSPQQIRDNARQDRKDAEDAAREREKLLADMKAKGFVPGPNGGWVADPDQPKPQPQSPETVKALKNIQLDEVLQAISNARKNTSGWSTGFGGQMLQPIGGTQARDLHGDLNTIGSALTVDKLAEMKAQSATGASGMGALSEKEGALLRDSVASLDQAQSTQKVNDSLDAIELHYRRYRALMDGQNPDDPKVQQAYGIVTPGMTPPPTVGGPPAGGSPPSGPSGGLPFVPGAGGGAPIAP